MRHRSGNLFPRDPYWLQARFPGVCAACGAHIAPGADAFYYPNSRHANLTKLVSLGNPNYRPRTSASQ